LFSRYTCRHVVSELQLVDGVASDTISQVVRTLLQFADGFATKNYTVDRTSQPKDGKEIGKKEV